MTTQPGGEVTEPVRDEPSRAIVVALPRELVPYARSPLRWRPGCGVTVLGADLDTLPAMLAAIVSAQRSIVLETYILVADETGDRFKAALIERAKAGVQVRLLYDAVGSFGLAESWIAGLRAAGVEAVCWNPIATWRRKYRLSHRDHRKILVIDDRLAFTGGINLSNDYASKAEGGKGWHDIHCKVTGPIVFDLARTFRRTWLRAGGAHYPPVPATATAPPGDGPSYVRLLDNTRVRARGTIRRAYLHAIRAARSAVWIQNAYFLPDRGLRRALGRAARRGVDVRVMVPGRSDVRLVEWASLYALKWLARAGVKVLRWRGPMMHAKTATVDEAWSTIGSYNFDAQSRFSNLEVNVEILDPETALTLAKNFETVAMTCDPFDESAWHHLPWWRKALAWLSYRLRRFL
ncbi:MAG TPA: phosphatidylserine/phosphatidylglycerophosphate/cardiolipin synthase family protein [Kofleriaceae bacterium]|jgi:cardiolipin synthase|nr:phosphatidylserine/phosphatidylglycerophosphate/cardiolipin synthase family protein [Kofleriaceae bacterium]